MPSKYGRTPTPLDLTSTSSEWDLECGTFDLMRVQAVLASGTWTSGVITVQQSIDGETWYDLDTPLQLTAEGITAAIDITCVKRIRFLVTTDQSPTAGTVMVHVVVASTTLGELVWRTASGGFS